MEGTHWDAKPQWADAALSGPPEQHPFHPGAPLGAPRFQAPRGGRNSSIQPHFGVDQGQMAPYWPAANAIPGRPAISASSAMDPRLAPSAYMPSGRHLGPVPSHAPFEHQQPQSSPPDHTAPNHMPQAPPMPFPGQAWLSAGHFGAWAAPPAGPQPDMRAVAAMHAAAAQRGMPAYPPAYPPQYFPPAGMGTASPSYYYGPPFVGVPPFGRLPPPPMPFPRAHHDGGAGPPPAAAARPASNTAAMRKRTAPSRSARDGDDDSGEEEHWAVVRKTSSGRTVRRRVLPDQVASIAHGGDALNSSESRGSPAESGASSGGNAGGSGGSYPPEQSTVSKEEFERRQRRMESNRVSAQRSRVRHSQMLHLATRAARGLLALRGLPVVALTLDSDWAVVSSSVGVAGGAVADVFEDAEALVRALGEARSYVRALAWLVQLVEASVRRRLAGFEVSALAAAFLRRRPCEHIDPGRTAAFATEGPCAVLSFDGAIAVATPTAGVDPRPAPGADKPLRVHVRAVVRPHGPAHELTDRIDWVLAEGTELRRQAFRKKRMLGNAAEKRGRFVVEAAGLRAKLRVPDDASGPGGDSGSSCSSAAPAGVGRGRGHPARPGTVELGAPGVGWWKSAVVQADESSKKLEHLLTDGLCTLATKCGQDEASSVRAYLTLNPAAA